MMTPLTALRCAIVAAVLSLGGCGGGGADQETHVNTQTLGQQLIDLQKARDTGALSQNEYDRERRRLLDH